MFNYGIDPLTSKYQKQMLAMALVAALSIFAIMLSGPLDIVKKHLFYFVLLAALAGITYPLRYIFPNKFYVFLWQTILILASLAGFSYLYPNLIGENIFGYMMLALGGLIISGLGELAILYFKPELYSGFYGTLTGYIGIALFMLFIVYDTNKIQQFAKTCVNADYIEQSTQLQI
jgi:FtsH-binding integral membrane protein